MRFVLRRDQTRAELQLQPAPVGLDCHGKKLPDKVAERASAPTSNLCAGPEAAADGFDFNDGASYAILGIATVTKKRVE